ncbi:MAG: class I SAM-dependent methyltransferase [Candidatus Korobacteraceae bacterium]
MDPHAEFEELRRESESWWYTTRRKILREAAAQAIHGRSEARVLDLGCTAQLEFDDPSLYRACNIEASLKTLAFRQTEGDTSLVCSRVEELSLASNSFDAVVAGDVLQSVPDDVMALREMRRVLKDGGLLCLTVPAYPFLWGDDDERRGHQRRYTISELRRKLNTCGFHIHRASYFVASAFPPLVAGRIAKDIFHKSVTRHQHYPQASRLANAAMTALLDGERHLMHYINLPFGTRVVCWALKPALVTETVTLPAWERQWSRNPLAQGSG